MSNRYIITISLYIILNTFFILIISQSKFSHHTKQSIDHKIEYGENGFLKNKDKLDEKGLKSREKMESNKRDQKNKYLPIEYYNKNFDGVYFNEIDQNKFFDKHAPKLAPETLDILNKTIDILNSNKELTITAYTNINKEDMRSVLKSFELIKTYADNLENPEDLSVVLRDSENVRLELKHGDN